MLRINKDIKYSIDSVRVRKQILPSLDGQILRIRKIKYILM
jgi:hypothetical protein